MTRGSEVRKCKLYCNFVILCYLNYRRERNTCNGTVIVLRPSLLTAITRTPVSSRSAAYYWGTWLAQSAKGRNNTTKAFAANSYVTLPQHSITALYNGKKKSPSHEALWEITVCPLYILPRERLRRQRVHNIPRCTKTFGDLIISSIRPERLSWYSKPFRSINTISLIGISGEFPESVSSLLAI